MAADWLVLLYVLAMFRLVGWLENRGKRAQKRCEAVMGEHDGLVERVTRSWG
jgi:hypothetical protein